MIVPTRHDSLALLAEVADYSPKASPFPVVQTLGSLETWLGSLRRAYFLPRGISFAEPSCALRLGWCCSGARGWCFRRTCWRGCGWDGT